MAIEYVGGDSGFRVGNTTTQNETFALTGGLAATPAAGDLVIVGISAATQGRTPTCRATSGGVAYNYVGLLVADGTTYDTCLEVSYKFMEDPPNTQYGIPSSGNLADGQRWNVNVYRGVDPVTPFDVAAESATGTGTSRPNPPPILPVTAGAWVYLIGAGAADSISGMVSPGGVTAFSQSTVGDTNDAGGASCQVEDWTSGTVNIGAYTGGSANAADSWAAYAIVLRPAGAAAAGGLLVLG